MARLATLLVTVLAAVKAVAAIGQNATIGFEAAPGRYLLGDKSSAVKVLVDSSDWKGVKKVAKDLATDFGRVTGLNGTATAGGASCLPRSSNGTASGGIIIAGTIGKSKLIDSLISAGKLDVAAIKGQWEAFTSQLVGSPVAGVEKALVIAGEWKSSAGEICT